MNKTGISWTDLTWNPVSGCSKVSPGCQNCYAEAWSHRWGRSFDVTLHPEKLKEVRKIPSGSKVFVNSMSDLFHPKVPTEFINQVFKAIETRPDVIFQILTKLGMADKLAGRRIWLKKVSYTTYGYNGEPFLHEGFVIQDVRITSIEET